MLLEALCRMPDRANWFIAGLSLVAASFIFVGLTEGEPTNGVYVPPHEVNGHVVSGHMEKARTP